MTSPAVDDDSTVRDDCAKLVANLVELGRLLFVSGAIFGPDRVEGRSQSGYGDDRIVGLAVAVEIAGDLAAASVQLLDHSHPYSAAALLRQIIEVEYLIGLFTQDLEAARRWLNADDDELRKIFRPAQTRKQSGDQFGDSEYHYHCRWGGHPTPHARDLLPEHSRAGDTSWMWDELACHLRRLWDGVQEALARHDLQGSPS